MAVDEMEFEEIATEDGLRSIMVKLKEFFLSQLAQGIRISSLRKSSPSCRGLCRVHSQDGKGISSIGQGRSGTFCQALQGTSCTAKPH